MTALTRVQQRGQVTIPMPLRRKLGIDAGDFVSFQYVDGGILLTPQKVAPSDEVAAVMQALDDVGAALKAKGISLEQMIEDGRKIRGEIAQEKYGLPDDGQA